MIGKDTNDELVVGTVETGLDRGRLSELQRQDAGYGKWISLINRRPTA
jgi:hypothetical protein